MKQQYKQVLEVLQAAREQSITLMAISRTLGYTAGTASISARIRDLRKPKYGGHNIKRKQVSNNGKQIHYYELIEG